MPRNRSGTPASSAAKSSNFSTMEIEKLLPTTTTTTTTASPIATPPTSGGLSSSVRGSLNSPRRRFVGIGGGGNGGASGSGVISSSLYPKGLIRSLVAWICFLVMVALLLNILTGFSSLSVDPNTLTSKNGATGSSKESLPTKSGTGGGFFSSSFFPSTAKNASQGSETTTGGTTTTTSSFWSFSDASSSATTTTTSTTTNISSTASASTSTGGRTRVAPRTVPWTFSGPVSSTSGPWLDEDFLNPPIKTKKLTYNQSEAFVERWCDLSYVDWYPTSKKSSWQQRAPAVLIPGAKFAGTTAVASLLQQHVDVVPPSPVRHAGAELGNFFEANFRRYVTAQERTRVLPVRQRIYARDFHRNALLENEAAIAMDATPGYLFYSTLLPRRILCVWPWVKMVVVLANPVDRVVEHYERAKLKGLPLDLESWIAKDYDVMTKVGLVHNWTTSSAGRSSKADNTTAPTFDDFYGSPEEEVAWFDYQTSTVEGVLGRSMYEIQLRQWFHALLGIDKAPADTVLIVMADALEQNPNEEYQRILKFLGLPQQELKNAPPRIFKNTTNLSEKDQETRKRLEAFYEPYNNRLKLLLRKYGLATRWMPPEPAQPLQAETPKRQR